MSKYLKYIGLCLFLAVIFAGCNFGTPEPKFNEKDLLGKWHSVSNEQEFLVFQDDGWGKTWDESDEVTEDMLVYHGNGWFEWSLEGDQLTRIFYMDNGGAEIPDELTLITLNAQQLVYKDNVRSKIYRFAK